VGLWSAPNKYLRTEFIVANERIALTKFCRRQRVITSTARIQDNTLSQSVDSYAYGIVERRQQVIRIL